jgi:transcriptional regulator with XRE-family HTH domain
MVVTLGSVLREIRDRYGLTQRDMADKVATARSTVSKWERDKKLPSRQQVDRIVEQFPYYRSMLYVTARSLPSDLSPIERYEICRILDPPSNQP